MNGKHLAIVGLIFFTIFSLHGFDKENSRPTTPTTPLRSPYQSAPSTPKKGILVLPPAGTPEAVDALLAMKKQPSFQRIWFTRGDQVANPPIWFTRGDQVVDSPVNAGVKRLIDFDDEEEDDNNSLVVDDAEEVIEPENLPEPIASTQTWLSEPDMSTEVEKPEYLSQKIYSHLLQFSKNVEVVEEKNKIEWKFSGELLKNKDEQKGPYKKEFTKFSCAKEALNGILNLNQVHEEIRNQLNRHVKRELGHVQQWMSEELVQDEKGKELISKELNGEKIIRSGNSHIFSRDNGNGGIDRLSDPLSTQFIDAFTVFLAKKARCLEKEDYQQLKWMNEFRISNRKKRPVKKNAKMSKKK